MIFILWRKFEMERNSNVNFVLKRMVSFGIHLATTAVAMGGRETSSTHGDTYDCRRSVHVAHFARIIN
jgi:hypothetical protein